MASIVASGVSSWLVSSCRINHFGKKPVNGGSPANDRRVSMRVVFSTGAFVHETIIVGRLVVLVVLSVMNTEEVIVV